MRTAFVLLRVLLVVYLAVLAGLFIFQRTLLFPRDPARAPIAGVDLPGLEEIELRTGDGETLVSWVVPPREGRPVLLFFHGNAGNFARPARQMRFKALTDDGTGLFAVNYRGYGGSTGTPTEAGLLLDARAAYEAAAARFGRERLVGYGESLGTGVVLQLAAAVPLPAIVLEAPFLSTAAVAQGVYPFIPVRLLMRDQFRSDLAIGKVKSPLLVLHGERDRVVPFAQGRALFDLANLPKRFLAFPEGGHEDLPAHGSIALMRRFLDAVARRTLEGSEVATVAPRG